MIKKLRIKLIMASMISLLTVLAVIMGAVTLLDYREMVTSADSTLDILRDNDGQFPDSLTVPSPALSGDSTSGADVPAKPSEDAASGSDGSGGSTAESGSTSDSAAAKPAAEKPSQSKNRAPSPELPYESRYFSVFLSGSGNVISVNTGKIAAVDTSAAISYAQTAVATGKTKGFVGDYRFVVYSVDTETHVVFLDCGRSMDSFRSFVLISLEVSAVGLLSALLLLIFLSGRIVKPFLENYEKQRRFITDAGHELKTPLTIINADAEVLEMDIGENEWLNDIKSQTGRLADLTNSLILLSRMEEEQPQTPMIEFPLSDVVEETVNAFQAPAKTQGRRLTAKIQPMLSMTGDEKAVRRLATILLDNAVKYAGEDGRIDVTLEKQKNQLRLTVFNTAEHISRESLPYLFDRFYRTDQSRNSQTGGYGLGLSIAAAIVAAHKGKISASTQDERSLLITVSFPAG